MRGARLKARFAVKGIQSSSRDGSVERCEIGEGAVRVDMFRKAKRRRHKGEHNKKRRQQTAKATNSESNKQRRQQTARTNREAAVDRQMGRRQYATEGLGSGG